MSHLFQRKKKKGTTKTKKGGMNLGKKSKTDGALLKKQKSKGK